MKTKKKQFEEKAKKKRARKKRHIELPEPSAMVRIKLESFETPAAAEELSDDTATPPRRRVGRPRGAASRTNQRRPRSSPYHLPVPPPPPPLLLRCSRCPAKLNTADNLRKHEMIHDGAKPIYCNRCEERFMTCGELQAHYGTHPGAMTPADSYRELEVKRASKVGVSKQTVPAQSGVSQVFGTDSQGGPASGSVHSNAGESVMRATKVNTSSISNSSSSEKPPAWSSQSKTSLEAQSASSSRKTAKPDDYPATTGNPTTPVLTSSVEIEVMPASSPSLQLCTSTVPSPNDVIKQEPEDADDANADDPGVAGEVVLSLEIPRHWSASAKSKQAATRPTPLRRLRNAAKASAADKLDSRRRTRHRKLADKSTAPTATHQCSRCAVKLTTTENLRKHEMTHDGAKPFFCELCDLRYMTLSALQLHTNTHTNARPYACDKCDKAYNDPSVLLRHKHSAHMGVRHQCKRCDMAYMTRAGLLQHMKRRHQPTERWPCPLCQKVFPLESYRNKHLEHTHVKIEPENKPQCHICHKRFKWPSCLASHMVRHSGRKDHPCRVCGRPFTESGARNLHELTHRPYAERPHQCQHCHKRFVQHGALLRHLRTHTGERPFSCAVCSASFGDHSALIRHKPVHQEGRIDHRKCPRPRSKPRNPSTPAQNPKPDHPAPTLKPEAPARVQPVRGKRARGKRAVTDDKDNADTPVSVYYEDPDSEEDELIEVALRQTVPPKQRRLRVENVVGSVLDAEESVIESIKPGLAGIRLKRRRASVKIEPPQ